MKICTKCNKEIKSSEGFCTEDGGKCVEKPASTSSPFSAQKIWVRGDISQNVSYPSETNVYNQDETKRILTCFVSGRNEIVTKGATCTKCDKWALLEYVDSGICSKCSSEASSVSKNRYRNAAIEALTDDYVIDSSERKILDKLAVKLGISQNQADLIEEEIRTQIFKASDTLGPTDKLLFKQSHDFLYIKESPTKAFDKLELLAENYPENYEIARMYVLASIETNPKMGLSFLSESPSFRADSAHKSLLKIELLEKLGKSSEAMKEERRALLAFRDDPLIRGKSLVRMLDLYLSNDQEEEEEFSSVREQSKSWAKPGPEDDPYLHYVDAYLRLVLEGNTRMELLGGGIVAKYFCSRKLRKSSHLFTNLTNISFLKKQSEQIAEGDFSGLSLEKLQELAEDGKPEAQVELGYRYGNGEGLPKDPIEGIEWLKKAADQGYVSAKFSIACIYGNGWGVERDDDVAIKWFLEVTNDINSTRSMLALGNLFKAKEDYEEARKWFRKADSDGWVGLGECLEEGFEQYEGAVGWYKKAAEKGNHSGMCELARCIYNSLGVDYNESSLLGWYAKAADANHPWGLLQMAEIASEKGDTLKCEKLLVKAAEQETQLWNSYCFNDGIRLARRKLKDLGLNWAVEVKNKPTAKTDGYELKAIENSNVNEKNETVSSEELVESIRQPVDKSINLTNKNDDFSNKKEKKAKQIKKKRKESSSKSKSTPKNKLISAVLIKSFVISACLTIIYMIIVNFGEYLSEVSWIKSSLDFLRVNFGIQSWFLGILLFLIPAFLGYILSYMFLEEYNLEFYKEVLPSLIPIIIIILWKFPDLWWWMF